MQSAIYQIQAEVAHTRMEEAQSPAVQGRSSLEYHLEVSREVQKGAVAREQARQQQHAVVGLQNLPAHLERPE